MEDYMKQIELHDFDIPPCPCCHEDAMVHKCFSHVPGTVQFRKNGWYCELCGVGPLQLGSVSEAQAARTALILMNK